MSKLPQISGKEVVKKFLRIGYKKTSQKGSHVRLVSDETERRKLTVPQHKILKKGMLSALIKDAGITLEEFLDL